MVNLYRKFIYFWFKLPLVNTAAVMLVIVAVGAALCTRHLYHLGLDVNEENNDGNRQEQLGYTGEKN